MPKKLKRDRAYYEARLRNEHPGIHADLLAGKFPSVRAASIAAGLVAPQTQLNALKNAWTKATGPQRKAFLLWLQSSRPHAAAPVGSARPRKATDSDGRLLDWADKRIREIRAKRGLTQNQVMREMRLDPRNTSLWGALTGTRINGDLVTALETWLHDNRSI